MYDVAGDITGLSQHRLHSLDILKTIRCVMTSPYHENDAKRVDVRNAGWIDEAPITRLFMATKVISGIQFSSLPSSYIRTRIRRGQNCPKFRSATKSPSSTWEIVDEIKRVAHEFFSLPVEEKMKLYSDDPSKTMRLSTSFNVKKETVHNWRDYLRLHCHPDVVSSYCTEVRQLGFRLQEAISESLGLDKDSLKNVLGDQGQHMAINYYPACPQPDLTFGLPAHTDPNVLTILLQDLQALSNGKYKSVWHRAVVNTDKARLSIASFLCPCDGADISAPKGLTRGEDGALYRDFTYAEYYKRFWSRNLDQEHCLELFKN
ncbi:flavanone 3-dioxygenase [Phtheirospermum japonicum]|uniref:Flavanone 3-dioxygenase n=1 Tax=Phtheirospermum japonicum TaxID=374723 RepID=A0A830B8N9_9LAMI|nr:flavanone 3-dioxygenase [Phtheirospermum japonicum]